MNLVLLWLKLFAKVLAAAVAGAGVGYVAGMIAAPYIIPGNNPHTDAIDRIGIILATTAAGATLAATAVVVHAGYHWSLRSQQSVNQTSPRDQQ